MKLANLLILEFDDPHLNLSLEEALFTTAERTKNYNVIRLWRNPPSVVMGKNNKVSLEVCIDKCLKNNVTISRRFTGGGAVYHDKGNINWTVVTTKKALEDYNFKFITSLYQMMGNVIVECLKTVNVKAKFQMPNAVYVGSRKISGMAMRVGKHAVLCHGTLLVNSNIYVFPIFLKRLKAEVTSVQKECGHPISIKTVMSSFICSFEKIFKIELKKRKAAKNEEKLMWSLYLKKYSQPWWIYGL